MMTNDSATQERQIERRPVTLDLEPEVYEFFHRKAQAAGMSLESYLCSTLSIVLGCKAFSKMSPCPPDAEKTSCPENG